MQPMKTVAVIGASNDRSKFGNKAMRAFQQTGHKVFPVHPAQAEVEGLPCFKSIREVPERPNLVSVYLGPERLLAILPDIAARGCDELWLNPGTVSDEVVAKAEELGLSTRQLCSIREVGLSPAEL
jgi:predicted CoA-binding protein